MAHCFIEKNSKYVDFKIFVPKNKCDFYILYFFQTRFYTKYSDREKKWYSRSFGTAAEHKNIVFTIYYIYRVS